MCFFSQHYEKQRREAIKKFLIEKKKFEIDDLRIQGHIPAVFDIL